MSIIILIWVTLSGFSHMNRLHFAWFFFASLCQALVARLRRREPTAAWSVGQQALVSTMRRHGQRLMAMDATSARARSDRLQRSSKPPRGVRFSAVRCGDHDALLVVPRALTTDIELLYFHGGGYVFGSPTTYLGHLGQLAEAVGARVTAPAYRLAPEHRFPCAVDDAVSAHRALVEEVGASRLVVAGDSAGATLALYTLIAAREQRRAAAAGIVLLSPWCDLSAATGSVLANSRIDWGDGAYLAHWARLYLGDADARDPRASPVYADLRGLPPLRVLVGGGELLLDQATHLVDAARAAGVDAGMKVVPDMVHGFFMLGPVFPARPALEQCAAWAKDFVAKT